VRRSLVIQEIFGLTPRVRRVVDAYAAAAKRCAGIRFVMT
jgi:hypothetical protein